MKPCTTSQQCAYQQTDRDQTYTLQPLFLDVRIFLSVQKKEQGLISLFRLMELMMLWCIRGCKSGHTLEYNCTCSFLAQTHTPPTSPYFTLRIPMESQYSQIRGCCEELLPFQASSRYDGVLWQPITASSWTFR